MPTKTLRLGTRRSLLARSQSAWVAREVERTNPGVKVELVGIDTRGDKILDVPLRAVEGKEFFVAEIDDALREKRVDFTVHSLKDLSLDRPKEFVLGAVPKRENPRDVILFNSLVTTRLKAGETIRIGTSAPRRLENIPAFLEGALPRFDSDSAPKLKFEEIRGNVNTRLARIHEPVSSERYLDGVVLAFAGIIRLWRDEEGRAELKRLLTGVRWMVLPLAECPAAPGQGALAVECRADDAETRTILSKIHDSGSEKLIRRERGLLAEWGGGCHQRFGAIAIGHEKLGELFFVRGSRAEGTFVEHLEWRSPPGPKSPVHFEPGREAAAKISALPAPAAVSQRCLFVAHSRAVPKDLAPRIQHCRIWTSGTSSWFKLARHGLWVEGAAEGLGFSFLQPTLSEPVLQLDPLKSWGVFTHSAAGNEWTSDHGVQSVFCTYTVEFDKTKPAPATHYYWGSRTQVEAFLDFVPADAHHACGPGKTADYLKNRLGADAKVDCFPSVEEWRKWLESV